MTRKTIALQLLHMSWFCLFQKWFYCFGVCFFLHYYYLSFISTCQHVGG